MPQIERVLPFTGRAPGGLLVVVEGVSRSGKSTLIRKLCTAGPRPARLVKWNAHPDLAPVTAELTRRRELSGLTSTLLFVADLRLTFESVALPALRAGEVVIYDRYMFTAWVRGILRGVPEGLLRELVAAFPRPDLTLFLDTDLETTSDRFLRTRHGRGWFGVGRDLYDQRFEVGPDGPARGEDIELAAFRWWSTEQARLYRRLAGPEGFVVRDHVDAFLAATSAPARP